MIWKAIILLSCALCVFGDGHQGHAVSEQRIKRIHKEHHGELEHIGSKKLEHHGEYAWSYPSYEFSYEVHDPHTHDKKGQEEKRDGDEVKGEYWLIEPDGRKRTVTYHADKHSGFNANVHYSDHHHHEHHEHKDKETKVEEKQPESVNEEENRAEEEPQVVEEVANEEPIPVEEERGYEGHVENLEEEGQKGEITKWGYGPKWEEKPNTSINHNKGHKSEESEEADMKIQEEVKVEEPREKVQEQKDPKGHNEKLRNVNKYHHKEVDIVSILDHMGHYGLKRGHHEEAHWYDETHGKKENKEEGGESEESRRHLERRKFDERRGYHPSLNTPYYGRPAMHPRFYRQNQNYRKISRRN